VPFLSSISVFCATAHERTALFSRRGSDRLYSGFAIVAENISGWFRSIAVQLSCLLFGRHRKAEGSDGRHG
jgi:hypothetical protein